MARKTPGRQELRRQAEAAEAQEKTPKGKTARRKKTTRKKTTKKRSRSKESTQRKRLIWCVYAPSMKEEARFPYDQRAEADAKAEQLRAKSNKPYFVQPVKEPIPETPAAAEE